jgi:hypothetical protein
MASVVFEAQASKPLIAALAITKGLTMGEWKVWGDRRRQHQEEGYEQLIVESAHTIVNPETTPERRERAQRSLINACVMVSGYHSLDAGRLYWAAIRKATEHLKGTQPNGDQVME